MYYYYVKLNAKNTANEKISKLNQTILKMKNQEVFNFYLQNLSVMIKFI